MIDSTIPLLLKSEISSLYPSSVILQPGVCRASSDIAKADFHATRLNCIREHVSPPHGDICGKCIDLIFIFYFVLFASSVHTDTHHFNSYISSRQIHIYVFILQNTIFIDKCKSVNTILL